MQIDSSSGNSGGLLWDVPENLITSEGALRVIVSDWGDNLASDESDGFSV